MKNSISNYPLALFLFITALSYQSVAGPGDDGAKGAGVKKVKDVVIYQDDRFYSSFPSIIRKPDGEFILAFRRAPNRMNFGEKGNNHVDPNSYLVQLRSKDGLTWSKEPELIYSHAFGGSQDPCLLQLKNGNILCASYGWAFVRPDGIPNLKTPYFEAGGAIFLGGYLVQSTDGAKTWKGPIYPPRIQPEINFSALGNPLPAYNRGALYEGKNGRVYWAVASSDSNTPKKTSVHLIASDDKGMTWKYESPIAIDGKVTFNETSMYETPKGDLIAFLRTAGIDDEACLARSTDGGKTFKPWEKMGFKGHPLQALRLSDQRVLLVYGYRHKPYGIRARILNAECTDFTSSDEVVLREDGGSTDIGYPWAVQLDKNRVLVVYYYNLNNGVRHIAATELQIASGK